MSIVACSDGENLSNSGFASTVPLPSNVSDVSVGTTNGDESGGTTEDSASTTSPISGTTSTTDTPTTGNPSGDTSGDTSSDPTLDPPDTTTGMTSQTTGAPDTTTGDPPDPPDTTTDEMMSTTDEPMMPMKDPQPATGMYEHCLAPEACDVPANVCLQLQDANMNVTDGYCTIFCNNVNECGVAPNSPAVQECFSISVNQKICGLKCNAMADCPTGMSCINLALPNNQSGTYCI